MAPHKRKPLDLSLQLASYEKKMSKLKNLLGAVLDDTVLNTFIVCGRPGIGKSYTIDKVLDARRADEKSPIIYRKITGKITQRAFWDHLVENSTYDCVTFFDDADFIFHDPVCEGLLREASEKQTQRIINYRTAKNKGDDSTTFDGKIVVSTNLRIGSMPQFRAVGDRFQILNLEITFQETLAKIGDLALDPHGFLAQRISVDGNKEILAFLRGQQHRIGEDKLTLRLFRKAQELYIMMRGDWREYAEDIVAAPDNLLPQST